MTRIICLLVEVCGRLATSTPQRPTQDGHRKPTTNHSIIYVIQTRKSIRTLEQAGLATRLVSGQESLTGLGFNFVLLRPDRIPNTEVRIPNREDRNLFGLATLSREPPRPPMHGTKGARGERGTMSVWARNGSGFTCGL